MDKVPNGAVHQGRRVQSARMAGLAAYCAALAIALAVIAVVVLLHSGPHLPPLSQFPSPGASLSSPGTEIPLVSAGKTPGVDVRLVQIAGLGSLLAAIGAIACGTVAVNKLLRRKRERF
jgi:hypothetical protein